jgi:hypothetical protein
MFVSQRNADCAITVVGRGSRFVNTESNNHYIFAQVTESKYSLINLSTGRFYRDLDSFENVIDLLNRNPFEILE